ncbi:hypothetical protein AU106_gp053 [Sinorhizobium phage phiM9]|uniref:Uncharacterized protein n=1 Tax=Sinorhizobium phage phiM9 TaxID=1636182 RepID=A0A0F6TH46_9CAUD|nr:hypothetical protein AU106_gp053 [Sinorhizobium phage phiM9]AKE44684.1 hypothetical protein Sm_phiM9_054 [Sinorhizobium phage phiM9]
MALPELANFEDKIANALGGAIDRTSRSISEGLLKVSDRIVDSVNSGIREVSGWKSLDLDDLIKLNFTGNVFDKIGERFSGLFSSNKTDQSRLEGLIVELKDDTVEQLEDVNKNMTKFFKKWDWDDEKEETESPKVEPLEDPLPEPKKEFNFNALFAGLFKNLFKAATKAVSVIALGAAITTSIVKGIDEWNLGEQIGESLGLNKNIGGVVNLLIGNAREGLLNKFARYGTYALAGATAGAVGLLPGIIVGGILGLAAGVIVDAISSWIGKDKIYEVVDELTDTFWSGLEYITGTDIKRLEKRIQDLTKGKGTVEHEILMKQKEINELETKIAQARADGKSVELQKLLNAHEEATAALSELSKSSENYDKRISQMREDIKNADKGLAEKIKEVSQKAWDYTLTIPVRMLDSMVALFTDFDFKKVWTTDSKDIWDQSTYTKFQRTARKFVNDFVWNAIDQIEIFITETLPQKFDEIVSSIQQSIEDAFADLKNLASIIADEVSVRDLIPEAIGGNSEAFTERVRRRLQETQRENESEELRERPKEEIRENTSQSDNVSDNLRNELATMTKDFSDRSTNVNAPIMNQNNITHRNMTQAPNHSKNQDSTSRLMDLANSGIVIVP